MIDMLDMYCIQVELIFDSGLYRFFTFSIKKEDQDRMIWGTPMPETVKDYTIEVQPSTTTAWHIVASIKVRRQHNFSKEFIYFSSLQDNYQRKRVHEVIS